MRMRPAEIGQHDQQPRFCSGFCLTVRFYEMVLR
jgi:hypothetical protein